MNKVKQMASYHFTKLWVFTRYVSSPSFLQEWSYTQLVQPIFVLRTAADNVILYIGLLMRAVGLNHTVKLLMNELKAAQSHGVLVLSGSNSVTRC